MSETKQPTATVEPVETSATNPPTPVVELVETTPQPTPTTTRQTPTGEPVETPGLSPFEITQATNPPASVVEPVETTPQPTPATTARQLGASEVESALHEVIDPELGVNVVDLGLVYNINVDENNYVTIDMTLTTPACPLNDILEEDVAEVLKGLPITGHRVQWVWQPLWSPDLITEEGRQQLQMIGFHI